MHPYGSSASGLCFKGSDVDVSVTGIPAPPQEEADATSSPIQDLVTKLATLTTDDPQDAAKDGPPSPPDATPVTADSAPPGFATAADDATTATSDPAGEAAAAASTASAPPTPAKAATPVSVVQASLAKQRHALYVTKLELIAKVRCSGWCLLRE